jgi:hypothetical protein
MRDLVAELKQLRLHGMALAYSELLDQGKNAGTDNGVPLISVQKVTVRIASSGAGLDR